MSTEFLVICLVACLVFTPNKLPMLARHLGLACRYINRLRAQVQAFWQQQQREHALLENQKKAEEGDQLYAQKADVHTPNSKV